MDDIKKGASTLDKEDDYNPWSSKYTDSMCQEIIDMFSKGKSQAQFCGKHFISTDCFQKWRKRHKKFDQACVVAHNRAREYWDAMRETYLVEDAEGAKMNWNAFNKMYNTRFNIPDKRTVRVKGLGKAKDEREMLKCLSKAVDEEELTPDEAQKLLGLVDTSLRVKQTCELEDRLAVLETAQGIDHK